MMLALKRIFLLIVDIFLVTSALKRTIIEHGPWRPKDPKYFLSRDEKKKKICLEFYSKVVDNVTIPQLWLCYSPSLQKPYCEVCWLFSDRNNRSNRAWIDGVSGDIHNMADKISRHEKTKIHITTASIYSQWKSGNTMDKDAEVINKNNISFWTKVLQRLLSVILTLCSLNLAFRGHRETSYDGVCEGGNFLAIVSLMAQYDDVLGEVISLPSRAVKYLSHSIQEELIALIGKAVKH